MLYKLFYLSRLWFFFIYTVPSNWHFFPLCYNTIINLHILLICVCLLYVTLAYFSCPVKPFGVIASKALNYLAFQYIDFERTWWWLFKKRDVRTQLDIYVYICSVFTSFVFSFRFNLCFIRSFIYPDCDFLIQFPEIVIFPLIPTINLHIVWYMNMSYFKIDQIFVYVHIINYNKRWVL